MSSRRARPDFSAHFLYGTTKTAWCRIGPATLCPVGTSDNSPPIYRWGQEKHENTSPARDERVPLSAARTRNGFHKSEGDVFREGEAPPEPRSLGTHRLTPLPLRTIYIEFTRFATCDRPSLGRRMILKTCSRGGPKPCHSPSCQGS